MRHGGRRRCNIKNVRRAGIRRDFRCSEAWRMVFLLTNITGHTVSVFVTISKIIYSVENPHLKPGESSFLEVSFANHLMMAEMLLLAINTAVPLSLTKQASQVTQWHALKALHALEHSTSSSCDCPFPSLLGHLLNFTSHCPVLPFHRHVFTLGKYSYSNSSC
jgi:hypothetical protein